MKKIAMIVILILVISTNIYADGFKDIKEGHWGFSYIRDLSQKGIINGYPDNTFKPENNLTRAEFAKMLAPLIKKSYVIVNSEEMLKKYRGAKLGYYINSDKFSKMEHEVFSKEKNNWSKKYFNRLAAFNVIGNIHPSPVKYSDYRGNITRGEIAYMVANSIDNELKNTTKVVSFGTVFSDEKDFGDLRESILLVRNFGIIDGYPDNTFKPGKEVTRAEVSKILLKLIEVNSVSDKDIADAIGEIEAQWKAETEEREKDRKLENDLTYLNEGEKWYQGGKPKTDDVKVENGKKLIYIYGYGWLPWTVEHEGITIYEEDYELSGISIAE